MEHILRPLRSNHRRCSENDLRRSCSNTSLGDLDDVFKDEVFKSPDVSFFKRKRKRLHKGDDDTLSLQSFQSIDAPLKEPKNKRRRSLAKVTSLASMLSPVRPVRAVGNALQKSLSLRSLMSPSTKNNCTPYKKPQPTPPKRRPSTYWHETSAGHTSDKLTSMQLERQEAIFELYKSEEDLIEDLTMVKLTYHDSMQKLKILSPEELIQIFGHIETYVPLHQELVEQLKEQRLPDGTTDNIGKVLIDWVPRLRCYVSYCANQVYARSVLDAKKNDPNVQDFLERCQESPFSRKLDLWSFLDVPRSRLVKYPLLFKAIKKLTPPGHEDISLINQAMQLVEQVLHDVDRKTGSAKCILTRDKLDFIDDKQKNKLIDESEVVLCDGILKNNRGTKLHVFLFNNILVLTRPATRGHQLKYQVYRQPIAVSELIVEDLPDGVKMGSFRSAFSQGQQCKYLFRVSAMDGEKGQTHTLQANDEHDKRQWLTCLKNVVPSLSRPEPSLSRTEPEGQESTN